MARGKGKPPPAKAVVTFDLGGLVPKEPPKTRSLRVRVTEEEHADMKAVADTLGVTVSTYLRELHRQASAAIRRAR